MPDGKWIKTSDGWRWENAKLAKYYRDWLAGKFVIPGLKVSIKDTHGNELGPASVKLKERLVNRGKSDESFEVVSVEFTHHPKVRLDA